MSKVYVTIKFPARYHKMSYDEFLSGKAKYGKTGSGRSATLTRGLDKLPSRLNNRFYIQRLIFNLNAFNEKYSHLFNKDRESLYREFCIPKKSGGMRTIDAPISTLMNALGELKGILEDDFHALYHTSAFAYVKGRSTVSCMKKHQQNKSNWFAKFDLSDFFGSVTANFVLDMLGKIYPFSEVLKVREGRISLSRALSLAFLRGGLPQGSPVSPTITNIIMIPIDFELTKKLRSLQNNKFIYTRYADDILVSSKYGFNVMDIENTIRETFAEFKAPFKINDKKTRYGSASGRNWNLGLMLTGDYRITVGRKNKNKLKAMLSSFAMDLKNGVTWPMEKIQKMDGVRSYCAMVEPDSINGIVEHLNKKFEINIQNEICSALSQ